MKRKISLLLLLVSVLPYANKPAVWLISDGGKDINDPDDISAIASYILMSNQFDTRAIVLGSTSHPWNKDSENMQVWAEEIYGKAYAAERHNLNKYIGGYPEDFRFIESSIKGCGHSFSPQADYSISDFPSILALYKEVLKSDEVLNVLCFGPLTEQAIFVSYCIKNNKVDLLQKVRFISHWTSSNFHVGTIERPEHTHNCFADPIACEYMKQRALNGTIAFFECGGIGQYGIVEAGPKGKAFFDLFYESQLGTIFRNGKFNQQRVDDSDCATYWTLLGDWGVSLNDIASNGLNFPDVEKRNEEAFAANATAMRKELLRRSNAAAGFNPDAVLTEIMVPEHGMADPHAWVENDTLWFICGHDKSWEPSGAFPMDRWEIWSSTDLKSFTYHNSILPQNTYIGDLPHCWAGDITKRNGKYYWFFSNQHINTGVVVADKIDGDYKDLLGRPLLPADIVPVNPYDPEIYIEDDVYTICFGAGTYYMATLSEDMMSLSSEPQAISIMKDGKPFRSEDKPTLFKRNNSYYLVFGSRYAMADQLYGPYTFMGDFLSGGHTSFFDWHGQKYVLQENHDISAFYRGASLKPVYFNDDGTIRIPKSDRWFPGPGRSFTFENSTMGWKACKGTHLYMSDGKLAGVIKEPKALIQSAPVLYTPMESCKKVTIKLRNKSYANVMRFSLATRDKGSDFWDSAANPIDWDQEEWITVPISSNDTEFQTYEIKLSRFKDIKGRLLQVAVQPAVNTYNGTWEIEEIVIK